MSAPVDVADAIAPTKHALQSFFYDERSRAQTPIRQQLWKALQDASDGGKMLRPRLFHSVYRALGGDDADVAGTVGAALELLHTALVIHDDVIDDDSVRRGEPNVAGTFAMRARQECHAPERANEYGLAAAILAGDLALTGAIRLIARCGAEPTTTAALIDHFDEALRVTAAGELSDVLLSLQDSSDMEHILTMEHEKTAAYSFALPLHVAATLADAAPPVEKSLNEFAGHLGLAYQLRDDLRGTFGQEDVTGKSGVSDLSKRKLTPIIAFARTTTMWPQIQRYFGSGELVSGAVDQIRRLLVECGAKRFVEDLSLQHCRQAAHSVDHLPIAPVLQGWVTWVSEIPA